MSVVQNVTDIQARAIEDRNSVYLARLGLAFSTDNLGLQIVGNVTNVDGGAVTDRDSVDLAVGARFSTTGQDLNNGVVQDVPNVDSRAVADGDAVDFATRAFSAREDLGSQVIADVSDVQV